MPEDNWEPWWRGWLRGRATGAITAAGSRNMAECWCQVPMLRQFVVRSQRSQCTDHHAPGALGADPHREPSPLRSARVRPRAISMTPMVTASMGDHKFESVLLQRRESANFQSLSVMTPFALFGRDALLGQAALLQLHGPGVGSNRLAGVGWHRWCRAAGEAPLRASTRMPRL
jgi:hypothetical protein